MSDPVKDAILIRHRDKIEESVAFKMWGVTYGDELALRKRLANSAIPIEAHPRFKENQRQQLYWARMAPECAELFRR